MEDTNKGGRRLTKWREGVKMNQATLAKRLGVSAPSISDWENGKKLPRVEHAVAIAALAGDACPVDSWVRDVAPVVVAPARVKRARKVA